MTGAQEQALIRLKKRHADLHVDPEPSDADELIVSWTKASDWGVRSVVARVTVEGRVVEEWS